MPVSAVVNHINHNLLFFDFCFLVFIAMDLAIDCFSHWCMQYNGNRTLEIVAYVVMHTIYDRPDHMKPVANTPKA